MRDRADAGAVFVPRAVLQNGFEKFLILSHLILDFRFAILDLQFRLYEIKIYIYD